MEHLQLHSSALARGGSLYKAVRYHGEGFKPEHLELGSQILDRALKEHQIKHPEDTALNANNYKDVVGLMKKDHEWGHLYKSAPRLEHALREHLGVPHPETPEA